MLSHLRFVPSPSSLVPRCPRIHPRPRPTSSRYLSTSFSRHSDLAPDRPTQEEVAALAQNAERNIERPKSSKEKEEEEEREAPKPKTYNEFLELIGEEYKNARPTNYLRGSTHKVSSGIPFRSNPTFVPPPPISDEQKEYMYLQFIEDPVANSARKLSQQYHISLKRVDAILRLKGLEKAWIKGKEIQTGFEMGMQDLLGVRDFIKPQDEARMLEQAWHRGTARQQPYQNLIMRDVQEADMLEQDENRDASRQRYQRLYWESMPEDGREPIVPGSLEHAKALAKRFTARGEELKAGKKLMPRVQNTRYMKRPEKVVTAMKSGRPTIQFVDVGAKFMDVDERMRRMVSSQRRARQKAKKDDAKFTHN